MPSVNRISDPTTKTATFNLKSRNSDPTTKSATATATATATAYNLKSTPVDRGDWTQLARLSRDWSGTGRGSHIDFPKNERPLLKQGPLLGSSAGGAAVHQTVAKGVALAWKRRHCETNRHVVQAFRKEIEHLKRLRHHHLVRLIGTYTHDGCLGSLVWPVAACDLETLYGSIDELKKRNDTLSIDSPLSTRLEWLGIPTTSSVETAIECCYRRIYQSIGCLVRAIAYVHSEQLAHKNLKPSNILLSRDGLWITDFSLKTPSLTQPDPRDEISTPTRMMYCAPEVAANLPSGQKADIFSLGCISLEIFWICKLHLPRSQLESEFRPDMDGSFHANLKHIYRWIACQGDYPIATQHVLEEIKFMLARDPTARPTAPEIGSYLTIIDGLRQDDSQDWPMIGSCCEPAPPTRSNSGVEPTLLSVEVEKSRRHSRTRPVITTTQTATVPAPPPPLSSPPVAPSKQASPPPMSLVDELSWKWSRYRQKKIDKVILGDRSPSEVFSPAQSVGLSLTDLPLIHRGLSKY